MLKEPLDLSKARILVTNDDGFRATGIHILTHVARELSDDVWVVAPELEQSGTGHSLTLRRPLRIREVGERVYAVDGTPTDSVMLAVRQVMQKHPPDLVLSGINRGGNMGEDVTYSGTVSAAFEATLLGIPAIALSLYYEDDSPIWETAEHYAGDVIRRLTNVPWAEGVLMNVNFPHRETTGVTSVEITAQGRRKPGEDILEGKDPRGQSYYWIGAQRGADKGGKGTDLEAVMRGAISITPLGLDFTHHETMDALGGVFSDLHNN